MGVLYIEKAHIYLEKGAGGSRLEEGIDEERIGQEMR